MRSSKLPPFRTLPHARARGQAAEAQAVAFLEEKGLKVLGRNVRTPVGEIDLIARDGQTLCFVEVKARASKEFGEGVAAVNRAKQRRMARAAAWYLARFPWDGACRFDVLSLDLQPNGLWRATYLPNAFEVPWP